MWSIWLLLPWTEIKIKFCLSSCNKNKRWKISLEISCQWSLPSITSSVTEPAPKASAISLQFLFLLKLFEKITSKIWFPPAITFSVMETSFFEWGNYLLKENRSRVHPDRKYEYQQQKSLWVRVTLLRNHFQWHLLSNDLIPLKEMEAFVQSGITLSRHCIIFVLLPSPVALRGILL